MTITEVASVAAQTCTILDLCELGFAHDYVIHDGLYYGLQICDAIKDGLDAEQSDKFSSRGLDSMDTVAALRRLPKGDFVIEQSAMISEELKRVIAGKYDNLSELKSYFSYLAESIPFMFGERRGC